jgi:catechol 2,3-dioxygenase-like lactoylglutathione lyase family enzyme
MQCSKLLPLLNVRSCKASLDFYTRLDLETVSTWEDASGVRFTQLRQGDVEILINEPGEPQAPRTGEPYGGLIVFFRVASVHALYAELRGKGPEPREPTSEAYGQDEMHLRDPDGYWLAFSSPLSVARSSAA